MTTTQRIQYQVITEPLLTTGEIVTPDKWNYPWSEPVRRKPPLPRGAYQFLAYSESAQFPESVTEDRWHQPWSEPIVKNKQGLRAGAQQFNAIYSPFVSFSWFGSLTTPVRIKPGLKPGLQQFFATDTAVIPTSKLPEWYDWLSDPVRIKRGLKSSLQQTIAWPPRLLPTPTVTATISALETKDVFLAGGSVFNPPASAEIGIVATGSPAIEIGVAEPAVASVRISIQII
jgi:hypothetical protein